MYSVPYSFDFYSNQLAVAIWPTSWATRDYRLWNILYEKPDANWHKRKKFYWDTNPLTLTHANFSVTTQMENTHTPAILVKLYKAKWWTECNILGAQLAIKSNFNHWYEMTKVLIIDEMQVLFSTTFNTTFNRASAFRVRLLFVRSLHHATYTLYL